MTDDKKTEVNVTVKRSWGDRIRAWRWPFLCGMVLGGAGGIGTAPAKPVVVPEPATKVVEVPKIIERQPVDIRVNYCGKEQPIIRLNGKEVR